MRDSDTGCLSITKFIVPPSAPHGFQTETQVKDNGVQNSHSDSLSLLLRPVVPPVALSSSSATSSGVCPPLLPVQFPMSFSVFLQTCSSLSHMSTH